ncbi:DNA glycosylase [Schizopora paradoxa]|uniref:Adenine DNA glycosylase n=1 Tax=Schizopora paradoxa TaxID=27342 RepID=A0A0H2RFW9_9AGAM|nr:DNA glycosylase [Schizopora paradoxa]
MSNVAERRKTKRVSYVYDSDASGSVEERSPVSKKRKRATGKKKETIDAYFGGQDASEDPMHPLSRHTISNPKPLRQALLKWFDGVHDKRGMPWRKRYDGSLSRELQSQRAYEVWISEIMLQQTQVVTVIPYYNRWMEKYPTIQDLAASDIETVNGLWKGLGYYSRAARLLSGAQKIVKEYDGLFPASAKEMIDNIPGIGRYSAGAISSIAYGHCEPVLDGNVNRLLSRVLALHANPKAKSTLDILWEGAAAMVKDADRPGDINQGLIELGSTVCKVQNPLCKECPLSEHCGAYLATTSRLPAVQDIEELCSICEPVDPSEERGVTRYPMKAERKKAREEVDLVNVIEWRSTFGDRHFVLARRPETGLLAGLYEFPTLPDVQDCSSAAKAKKLGDEVLSSVLEKSPATKSSAGAQEIRVSKTAQIGDVLHVFSHIRKTYTVQWILLEGGDAPPTLNKTYSSPVCSAEPAAKKAKTSKKTKESEKKSGVKTAQEQLQWVAYDEVARANIGTGVMKIWKKICSHWDSEG